MRWIIGDIHGMLRPLVALLEAISRRDARSELYFVGDFINRGPDSRGVMDLLLVLRDAALIRGNHDDIFDFIVNGQSYCDYSGEVDRLEAFAWFANHGLYETYASYGVDYARVERLVRRPTLDGLERLNQAIPVTHRRLIRSLPAIIQADDLFIAHASWAPDETDDPAEMAALLAGSAKLRHRLLWGRFGPEITFTKRWRRPGYFGHTPVEVYPPELRDHENYPVRTDKTTLLDTGAALSLGGRLSAVCADSGEIVQVDRFGSPVSPPKMGA